MTDVGGFFATLKLNSDLASFQKGTKAVTDIGKTTLQFKDTFKGTARDIIGWTMKMGAAFLALGAAMAGIGVKTAGAFADLKSGSITAGGMDPAHFKLWGDAAELAGSSADAMSKSLSDLNDALQNLKFGNSDDLEKASKAFAVGFNQSNFLQNILNKNPEDRLRAILEAFEKAKDKQLALATLRNAGMSGIADFETQALARGTTGTQLYAEASKRNYISTSDINAGARASLDVNKVSKDFENVGQDIGNKILTALDPFLKDLDNWFVTHKPELDAFAKAIGDIASALFGFAKKLGEVFFGTDTLQGRHSTGILEGFLNPDKKKEIDASHRRVQAAIQKGNYSGLSQFDLEQLTVEQMDPWKGRPTGPGLVLGSGNIGNRFNDILSKVDDKTRAMMLTTLAQNPGGDFHSLSGDSLAALAKIISITGQQEQKNGDIVINFTVDGIKETATIGKNTGYGVNFKKALSGTGAGYYAAEILQNAAAVK